VTDGSIQVATYLDALEHPHEAAVRRLRGALLASVPGLTEHVKWNAPSFVHDGRDRITFRLRPGDRLQLVFHRGAAVRTDVDTFTFADPTGLMAWQAPDRAVVTFADLAAVEEHLADVLALARRWVLA